MECFAIRPNDADFILLSVRQKSIIGRFLTAQSDASFAVDRFARLLRRPDFRRNEPCEGPAGESKPRSGGRQ